MSSFDRRYGDGSEGLQHATQKGLQEPIDTDETHTGLVLGKVDPLDPFTYKLKHGLGRAPDFVFITPEAGNPGLVYVLRADSTVVVFTGTAAFTFATKLT